MNIIRKMLLRLARGVAQEEVIPRRMATMLRVNAPVEKIKIGRIIWPGEYSAMPIEDIISYSKRELAHEIAEKMAENGMIRYQVKEPAEVPERIYRSDILEGEYTITAEVRIVKWSE